MGRGGLPCPQRGLACCCCAACRRTAGAAYAHWQKLPQKLPALAHWPPSPLPSLTGCPHPCPPRSYASYCANVARTYFVDPSKEQEAHYAALQEAQAAAVAALVEGAPMSAAYEAVVATLKVGGSPGKRVGVGQDSGFGCDGSPAAGPLSSAGQQAHRLPCWWQGDASQHARRAAAASATSPCCSATPLPRPLSPRQAKGQEALVERLTKNVGTAIGLELRDTTQPLNATNTRPVKAGMTFNVAVGAWLGWGAEAVGQAATEVARAGGAPLPCCCCPGWQMGRRTRAAG